MQVWIEYNNMSFEKVDGVWIHKDLALPGDFGDIYEKPAAPDLAERVELAYQVRTLEKKLAQKESPKPIKEVTTKRKIKDMDIDLTKTLEENNIKNLPKVKKNNLLGGFNPFRQSSQT